MLKTSHLTINIEPLGLYAHFAWLAIIVVFK